MPAAAWRSLLLAISLCPAAFAQVAIAGRVVDENGSPVAGARVEFHPGDRTTPAVASSDQAGNFSVVLARPGEYNLRAERLGFYLYQGRALRFEAPRHDLSITLNHLQEFSERIDVTASPAAIDPKQPSDRKELTSTEAQTIPYPAPQDYRNALPMFDGVVMDNSGRPHFNGGQTHQTAYRLNGFDISNPVTGRLDTRVNIETIQSMEVETSRFGAETGRGSAGSLELRTKMGDDRWRFGGTNFIPSLAAQGGWRLNKWTPRVELSGPIARGRAWFHNGFDAFYSNDVIQGLPRGENQTTGISASNLHRVQVNLTPANSLVGSFLYNLADTRRLGLSFMTPWETTTDRKQTLYMSTLRDQWYFERGALLDIGFADSRGLMRDLPQGDLIFQITPFGNRGNYFVHLDRHFDRQQIVANLFLRTLHGYGSHELKFGIDIEREAFHQRNERRGYEVLRADESVARRVSFAGNPFQERKNLEAAQYIQDSWTPFDGLALEAGVRTEWNQITRDMGAAPRFAVAWAPRRIRDTKFSAGWGVYHDSLPLEPLARRADVESFSMFYSREGAQRGPVATSFLVEDAMLKTPSYWNASVSVEKRLPGEYYLKSGYIRRSGSRGLVFTALTPADGAIPLQGTSFRLANARRDRYDAFEISLRHTFAGRFEWFAGYTRSSARSNAAVEYSLENPVFAPQAPGPFAWDTPHRFHMWGWAPVPVGLLPRALQFLMRNTTAAYLVEYRSGFPFGIVDEEGVLVGNPNSVRMPGYFNINLHLERQFRALNYLWAWRFGYNNLTNNGNPNHVNNVLGTPQFLTYGRGQNRAFSVRLRMLGRK